MLVLLELSVIRGTLYFGCSSVALQAAMSRNNINYLRFLGGHLSERVEHKNVPFWNQSIKLELVQHKFVKNLRVRYVFDRRNPNRRLLS